MRPGPFNERVAAVQRSFLARIPRFVDTAIEHGQVPTDEDPEQLTLELS